jgi:hypothetical protein
LTRAPDARILANVMFLSSLRGCCRPIEVVGTRLPTIG